MRGLSETAAAWLEARGIDLELADRFSVTSDVRGTDEWISVPYVKAGKTVNHKHRKLSDKAHCQDKGADKCFWNYDVVTDPSLADEPLIITEGEWDAMIAIQCGHVRTVSVPDGAPSQEIGDDDSGAKYSYVMDALDDLRPVKQIILAVDGDAAGAALFNDLAVRLGKSRVKQVRYPKGCKDLNEAFLAYRAKGVTESIRRAEFCFIGGIYRMSELPPKPAKIAYSTGKDWLDPHYKIRMGDFCVITGRPSDGKSTLVNDIMCSVVMRHGWTVAFASFEQDPQDDHKRALREWFAKVPESHMSSAERDRADEWIERHFVFIVPHWEDFADLDWVLERAAATSVRHGARVIVIDPWNEMDHARRRDQSLTEYTGEAIKRFKRLATGLDVHVIVVAHPTKLKGDERPGLYAISDSAHWANKPEVGIVVYKPDREKDYAEIEISKSRYHDQIGRPGTVDVEYLRLTRRFQPTKFDDNDEAESTITKSDRRAVE